MTRIHTARTGSQRGGQPYGRGSLFHMLRNRVYVGDIVHGDRSYPGAHPPIIDPEVFDRVQAMLDSNVAARRDRAVMPGRSPLTGQIIDADGLPMTPALAYGKLGRKYRYYVSHPLQVGSGKHLDRDVVRLVAAGAIEALVMGRLTELGLIPDNSDWRTARQVFGKVHLNRQDITISLPKGDLGPAAIAGIRERLSAGQKLVEVGGKAARLDLILPRTASLPGRPDLAGLARWIVNGKPNGSRSHAAAGTEAGAQSATGSSRVAGYDHRQESRRQRYR